MQRRRQEAERARHRRAARLLGRGRARRRDAHGRRGARAAGVAGGLVRLRGQWVELDRERLREVLDHWKRVEREAEEGGLTFLEGMRLLAGAGAQRTPRRPRWRRPRAGHGSRPGAWLARDARGLRGPEASPPPIPAPTCAPRCGPTSRRACAGCASPRRCGWAPAWPTTWAWARRSRCSRCCCCASASRAATSRRSLLVVPASLIANWKAELERFAPALRMLVAHPSAMPARRAGRRSAERTLDGIDLVDDHLRHAARAADWLQRYALALVDARRGAGDQEPGHASRRARSRS